MYISIETRRRALLYSIHMVNTDFCLEIIPREQSKNSRFIAACALVMPLVSFVARHPQTKTVREGFWRYWQSFYRMMSTKLASPVYSSSGTSQRLCMAVIGSTQCLSEPACGQRMYMAMRPEWLMINIGQIWSISVNDVQCHSNDSMMVNTGQFCSLSVNGDKC